MSFSIDDVRIEPIERHHVRSAFCCKVNGIQNFCRNNIRKHHDSFAVRCYVACHGDSKDVLGYYTLCLTAYSSGAVDELSADKFARVDSVPAVYLGMLGVHTPYEGKGIGKRLMADAFEKTLQIADIAGTYALALNAIDDEVAGYYEAKFGFTKFGNGTGERQMFVPLSVIRAALGPDV